MSRSILKIFLLILAVVALYFAFDYIKGEFIDWYSDNYIPRPTAYPSSVKPDDLCLTWNGDPKTTQAIQWRSAPGVPEGFVQFREQGDTTSTTPREVQAKRETIEDDLVENDPSNLRFSATMEGLKAGTAYEYRVGSKEPESWSEWASFTTAPAQAESFSFVYWGDVQNGYAYWGKFVQQIEQKFADTRFCLIAGDLVNNGDYRDQWDAFFAAENLFMDSRPLIPTLGNHDYDGKEEPNKYLQMFTLPENGPKEVAPERAFTIKYGNVLFVVLDSNRKIAEQTPWLEEQLKNTDATWKCALYHHPAYVSKPGRANDAVREEWGALFDKYGLDIAFQGHDHAYLRTYPMRGGKRAGAGEHGTVYLVSVAGNKYYPQEPHDYSVKQFSETSTYQIVSIGTQPDTLTYRCYDMDGTLQDEFALKK